MHLRLLLWFAKLRQFQRSLRFGLLTSITILIICACASNAPLSQTEDHRINVTADASATATRVVKHALGETKVSVNPQRVVVLDTAPLDGVLALGVKPVGATLPLTASFPAYLGDRTAGITTVGKSPPNLEAILRLKPDLIIGNTSSHQQIYDKLSQIAPTILVDGNSTNGQWQEELRLYAAALGRTAAVPSLLNEYNQRVESLQQQLKDQSKIQVSVIVTLQGWISFYTRDSFPGSVLADVGLARPPAQNQRGKSTEQVSREDLDSIDGDAIFLLHVNSGRSDSLTVTQFANDPLFSQLSAVKQNRVYQVDAEIWHLGSNILGANRLLDDLCKYLAEQRC